MNKLFLSITLFLCITSSLLSGAQPPIYVTKHATDLHDEQYKAHALCLYYQKQLPEQLCLFENIHDCVPKDPALIILEYISEMARGALHLIHSVNKKPEATSLTVVLHKSQYYPTSIAEILFTNSAPPPISAAEFRLPLLKKNREIVNHDKNFDPLQPDNIADLAQQADAAGRNQPAVAPTTLDYHNRLRALIKLSRDNYQKTTDIVTSYWQARENERQRFFADALRVNKEKALLSKLTNLSEYAPLLLCTALVPSLAMYRNNKNTKTTAPILEKIKELSQKIKEQSPHADKKLLDRRKRLYAHLKARLSHVTVLHSYVRETLVGVIKANACAIANNLGQYYGYYFFSNPYSLDEKNWPSVTRFVSLPHLAANYILFDITWRCWHNMCSNIAQKCDQRLRPKLTNYEYDDLKRSISNAIKIGVPMYLSLEGIRRRA